MFSIFAAKQKLSHEDIEYAFEKREKMDKKQLDNSAQSSMYNWKDTIEFLKSVLCTYNFIINYTFVNLQHVREVIFFCSHQRI